MKKILIDCGSNKGQGLRQLTSLLNITKENWEVILFEPNENCFNILRNNNYDNHITLNQKAVFDKNTQLEFKISKANTTTECGTLHSECYGNQFFAIQREEGWRDDSTLVDCVDIADVISPLIGNEIYLKLDIEGSEYEVLERLINTKLIHNIKNLYVEFHDQYMKQEYLVKYDIINRQNKIINYIKNNTNVELNIWH